MALLELVTAPDPRLKIKAKKVAKVDDKIRKLLSDMVETMHAAPGIGLAGPQVGEPLRLLVSDVPREGLPREGQPPNPMKIVNPEIVWASEELASREEGCLSFPDQFADVERPAEVKVRYLDHENEIREIHAKDLLAVMG